ncbi:pectinesterase [Artemisia annua]|uniref:Pectinesterase n=1 Tax=Artemisia annua TaxID=35608 RepID=A0A2U1LGA6_ARTAN|nr:pectinesterase [Artemisia annua]
MGELAAYLKGNVGRYVVYVKEGIYDEYVIVTKDQVNVFTIGDGAKKTIITRNRSHKTGWTTYKSATLTAFRSPSEYYKSLIHHLLRFANLSMNVLFHNAFFLKYIYTFHDRMTLIGMDSSG